MITKDSPLVETSALRLVMSESLLQTLADKCWENGDDVPTNNIDPSCLAEFRELITRLDWRLKELEAANDCYA